MLPSYYPLEVFIVAQIPLADARPLVGDTGRLERPPWGATTEAGKDFVRSLGTVRKRLRPGTGAWLDESTYCDARRAIRFAPSGAPSSIGLKGESARLVCSFRRYFSDGRIALRIEAGLRVRRSRSLPRPLEGGEVNDLVRGVMALPVVVGNEKAGRPLALAQAGDRLAAFLLTCTTRRNTPIPTESWWIASGEPIFLAEYRSDEVSGLPPRRHIQGSPILDDAHVDLSFATISLTRDLSLGTWLLGLHPDSDQERIRLLRIHLLRLHAQREVLRQLIRLMGGGKIDAASDDSQRYLGAAFSLLSAERKGGVDQPELLAAAYQSDQLAAPGDQAALLDALEGARRQIRDKIKRGLEEQPTSMRARIVPIGT